MGGVSSMFLMTFASLTMGAADGDVNVKDLRCEYLVNPLGVDRPNPRLSWRLESTERGVVQAAYQILVADSLAALDADNGNLWDSARSRVSSLLSWRMRVRHLNRGSGATGKCACGTAPARLRRGVPLRRGRWVCCRLEIGPGNGLGLTRKRADRMRRWRQPAGSGFQRGRPRRVHLPLPGISGKPSSCRKGRASPKQRRISRRTTALC